jgi:hypothetical protein
MASQETELLRQKINRCCKNILTKKQVDIARKDIDELVENINALIKLNPELNSKNWEIKSWGQRSWDEGNKFTTNTFTSSNSAPLPGFLDEDFSNLVQALGKAVHREQDKLNKSKLDSSVKRHEENLDTLVLLLKSSEENIVYLYGSLVDKIANTDESDITREDVDRFILAASLVEKHISNKDAHHILNFTKVDTEIKALQKIQNREDAKLEKSINPSSKDRHRKNLSFLSNHARDREQYQKDHPKCEAEKGIFKYPKGPKK